MNAKRVLTLLAFSAAYTACDGEPDEENIYVFLVMGTHDASHTRDT